MSQAWNDNEPKSAYLHIPFCEHRCGYCNFAVVANRDELMSQYLVAIELELRQLQIAHPMQTIFIGGGTPTRLPLPMMRQFLETISRWLPLEADGEFSIEANPKDISDELCQTLQNGGVNRISLGVQSFDDEKLRSLDRTHKGDQSITAIQKCQEYFSAVSADLIFAAPSETLELWQSDLSKAIELNLEHVSTYALTIEKGTRFWSELAKEQLPRPPESLEADMYEAAINFFSQHNLPQYEVSNFAKPQQQCRHNHVYWSARSWLAFGAGAARFFGSRRSVNHASTTIYIKRLLANESPIADFEELAHRDWTVDAFVFGMRRIAGVDLGWLKQDGDLETVQKIETFLSDAIEQDWVTRDGEQVKLTRQGLMLSDSIWPLVYRAAS